MSDGEHTGPELIKELENILSRPPTYPQIDLARTCKELRTSVHVIGVGDDGTNVVSVLLSNGVNMSDSTVGVLRLNRAQLETLSAALVQAAYLLDRHQEVAKQPRFEV